MASQVSELDCRDCSPEQIEACIQRALLSPGAKRVLREALAAGTATETMMRQLQAYCQRLAATPTKRKQGILSRMKPSPPPAKSTTSARVELPPDLHEAPTMVMDARAMQAFIAETIAQPSPGETLAESMLQEELPKPTTAWMLHVHKTGHRVAVPHTGRLTLGSLDPFGRIFPDIDLSYDDREHRSVALVHASITGQDDMHIIEDFGSTAGTSLNGQRLLARNAYRLERGDILALGLCELAYEPAPSSWTIPGKHYILYATPTGHVFELSEREELIIGRSDPRLGFKPDVDLSAEGDTATLVSRRHAALRYHGGFIEVADLGSTNKTRINGALLPPGVWVPLRPGQHLWLGGFGLSLDTRD